MLRNGPIKIGKFFVFLLASFGLVSMILLISAASSTYAQISNSSSTVGSVATAVQVKTDYNSTYPMPTADLGKPLTVNLENHLYKPGSQIKVEGSVYTQLVKQINTLNLV